MVNKMNGETLDLTAQNIARLKELFPEILTDGDKIDFDMLKTVLGEVVETEQERYQFTWHGKKKMIEGAQKPSKGTLRPVPEKSKNFDTTENLYIEGDNLEVLKLLQKSYNGKIKMIYIDPPYNTGKDFVYKDNFKDGIQNYLEQTGQVDAEGNVLSTNTESNGRFHTDWLNMFYARMKITKNLLHENGVICVSIGDDELSSVRMVCDEIFGEKNRVCIFTWRSRSKPTNAGNSKYRPQKVAEYVLVYGKKSVDDLLFNVIPAKERSYPHCDERGSYRTTTILTSNRGTFRRETMRFESNGYKPGEDYRWKAGKTTIDNLFENNKIIFNDEGIPLEKKYQHEETDPLYPIYCFMDPSISGTAENGKNELNELVGNKHGFDTVKPVQIMKYLISTFTDKDDYILDIFSGSATTAQAVLEINKESSSKRKFILIQIPEKINVESEAYEAGFKTICDIALKRIDNSIIKIKGSKDDLFSLDKVSKVDYGYKVLRLDTSNIREWNVDFDNLNEELDLYETPFVDGRSELDIVYEIMLKQGLELTYPIETSDVNGKTIYDIAFGSLFICLANGITTDVVKAITARRDELGTETSSVIFSDVGFSNDSDKLNCIETLKDAGYPEDNLLTI